MNNTDFESLQHFAVLGLGTSGIAAANLLAHHGKSVLISDSSTRFDLDQIKKKLNSDVEVIVGENVCEGADCVVISPGLPPSNPLFSMIPEETPVLPEVELARLFSNHRWLGITGTDGKTTTTELTAHILNALHVKAVAAGNIGIPLCEVILKEPKETIIVAELSAFQMWSARDLFLDAMAITNIAPDHLDYFEGDMSTYIDSKLRLFLREGALKYAIVNASDQTIAPYIDAISEVVPHVITYYTDVKESSLSSVTKKGESSLYYFPATRHILFPDGSTFDWGQTKLIGHHNAANAVAAAALAATLDDVPYAAAISAVCDFNPSPHRIECFGTYGGVRWINDSKATNPHASQAGIEALGGGDVVAIVGGVDKQLDLKMYASFLKERTSYVILIGQLRHRLQSCLLEVGYSCECVRCAETLQQAVEHAAEVASPGGNVILSPACSSFDMFQSYADRGDQFKSKVVKYYDSFSA